MKEDGETLLRQIRLLEYPNKLQKAAQGSADGTAPASVDTTNNQNVLKRQKIKLHDVVVRVPDFIDVDKHLDIKGPAAENDKKDGLTAVGFELADVGQTLWQ